MTEISRMLSKRTARFVSPRRAPVGAPAASRRMRSILSSAILAPALVATLVFSSCGGSGGETPNQLTGGSFVVVKTEPANNGQIFLNQSLKIFMSNPIDLSTANFNSIVFTVTDLSNNPVPDTVLGKFQYGTHEQGVVRENILEFQPRLPTNDTFTDGGFKPARIYRISLVADNNSRVAPTLRDKRGRSLSPLSPIQTMTFRTASGKTPQELFLDVLAGGPRVTGVDISPTVESGGETYVTLNRLGELPVEVKLDFNQPLNPSSANIPLRQDLDPLLFAFREKGRIFLEYDETEAGQNIWIPAQVEVVRNDASGATIVLRPDAVLPNNAEVRVIVEADLQDISGESNVKDASYVRKITTFRTLDAFEPMFDSVLLSFEDGGELLDPTATFRDPVADLNNGVLHSAFDFEGLETPFDFVPSTAQKELVLRTDFTTVQPRNGPPLPIVGGVFQFNRIEIPDGVTVRFEGPNPAVLISRTTVTIGGRIIVDGHAGEDVFTENSGHVPTKGGVGQGAGGNGGRASQTTGGSTQRGEFGYGAGQVEKGGGQGGQIHCLGDKDPAAGAGGGGGSQRTRGDDDYYGQTPGAIVDGSGGEAQTGPPSPGSAGTPVFIDPDPDNDFWGRQITATGELVVGEIPAPVAGSGGGGGGDQTAGSSGVPCDAGAVNFINDKKGGGGGGGGGVLIIKALGAITIANTGLISASGGNGGGGQPAGSSLYGGGGGGGSGGMIVLMSADKIQIDNHNNPWSSPSWDPDFAVVADGGIGQNYKFGTQIQERFDKYLGVGNIGVGAPNRGGFGSLGVVQLMVPPGNDSDNTGSVQDDNVVLRVGNSPVTGQTKLAWLNHGDIRPQPFVMPVPFGRYSKARTRWIATGATVRREQLPPVRSAGARSINKNLGTSGPEWFFSGLETSGKAVGYVKTDPTTGVMAPRFEIAADVTSSESNATTKNGLPAHLITVAGQPFPVPGQQDGWSYANYRAVLKDASNATVGEFRILDNSRNELWLDGRNENLPSGIRTVEIYASFIEAVNGFPPDDWEPGLGDTFQANATTLAPRVNFQVGFAFHKEPWKPEINNGNDAKRFPQGVGQFLYGLDIDNFLLRDQLRALHYPYVQVEVRFNLAYNPDDPNLLTSANELQTTTRRPGLRLLRLPYRF